MIGRYQFKFNNPLKKDLGTDKSWEWYMHPKGDKILVRKRYDWSIASLYGNVLDVGSADGFGAYLMSKNPKIKHITCLEIKDAAIEKSKRNLKGIKNIKIVKGIGEDMPFKEKFDSIHCGSTLEHAFDDRAVLQEIKRLLKGLAVISVPIHGGISFYHIREYKSNEEFLKLLEEYFKIVIYKTFPKATKERPLVVMVMQK